MMVVYLWLKPFSSAEDDTEHLLFMHCAELYSNIKTFLFLHGYKVKDTADRPR